MHSSHSEENISKILGKLSRTNSCLTSKMLQTHLLPEDKALAEGFWLSLASNQMPPLDGGLVWEAVQFSGEAPRAQIAGVSLHSSGNLCALFTSWFLPRKTSPS